MRFLNQSIFALIFSFAFFVSNAQTQNATLPKDAPVEVRIANPQGKLLPNEVVIFRSMLTDKEYSGISDANGFFALRLPAGDRYEIFILGFKDSTAYNVMDIAPLANNAVYKNPFKVDIKFLPAKTFVLDNCNFDFGKATLLPSSYAVIDDLVEYMNRKTNERIEIGGHTDNVGKKESNIKLSQERADAVKAYLIAKGIDESRIETKGYGWSDPIEDNKTEEGRAANRRTEVKILE